MVITIVLLPSIFFGYKLVQREDFLQKANMYVSNVSIFEGNYLLKYDIDATSSKITLTYGGSMLSETQKNEIIKKSTDFELDKATILVEQGLTFSDMDEKNVELIKLKEQVINLNFSLSEKDSEIDSILIQQKFGLTILNEIKPIFPQINGCIYSESLCYHDTLDLPKMIPVVILSIKSEIKKDDKVKINNWLIQRLKNNDVKIYYE